MASASEPFVFISYSTEQRTLAKRLHDDLGQMGAVVFQFEETATPGMPAWTQVLTAIRQSDWFIVLLTEAASRSGPVLAEIEHAYHQNVNHGRPRLVPAHVEAVAGVPLLLTTFTGLPFDDYASGLERLGKLLGLSVESSAKAVETVTADRVRHELVWIPGGKLLMGSPDQEEGRFGDEGPQHEVELDGFYIGRYPVTNEEYGLYLEANPGTSEPGEWGNRLYNQPRQPVVGVTWKEASTYCAWAGLVLPTEAQWEYACRAGAKKATRYWSGNSEKDLARIGWYSGNSKGRLHPVGEKPANPFGLFDVHGNVFEWCRDWFGGYDLPVKGGDGERLVSGGSARVRRGGSFRFGARHARSAYRLDVLPGFRWYYVGFRPAKAHP